MPGDRIVKQIMPLSRGRSTRILIVDSGTSYHLVEENELTPEELSRRRPMPDPIPLQTANSVVWATHETDIYIHALNATLTAALPNTPLLLLLLLLLLLMLLAANTMPQTESKRAREMRGDGSFDSRRDECSTTR